MLVIPTKIVTLVADTKIEKIFVSNRSCDSKRAQACLTHNRKSIEMHLEGQRLTVLTNSHFWIYA